MRGSTSSEHGDLLLEFLELVGVALRVSVFAAAYTVALRVTGAKGECVQDLVLLTI